MLSPSLLPLNSLIWKNKLHTGTVTTWTTRGILIPETKQDISRKLPFCMLGTSHSEWCQNETLWSSKIPIGNKILKESFPLYTQAYLFNEAVEIFCSQSSVPHAFFNLSFRQLAWRKYFFLSLFLLSFGRYHATFTYISTLYIKIHFTSEFLIVFNMESLQWHLQMSSCTCKWPNAFLSLQLSPCICPAHCTTTMHLSCELALASPSLNTTSPTC